AGDNQVVVHEPDRGAAAGFEPAGGAGHLDGDGVEVDPVDAVVHDQRHHRGDDAGGRVGAYQPCGVPGGQVPGHIHGENPAPAGGVDDRDLGERVGVVVEPVEVGRVEGCADHVFDHFGQIGRASCRERGERGVLSAGSG